VSTLHISDGLVDEVWRDGPLSRVAHRAGYMKKGHVCCVLTDSGNGFIAHFPSDSIVRQDHYVCLDYAQARDLVLALSEFQKELGFATPKAHP